MRGPVELVWSGQDWLVTGNGIAHGLPVLDAQGSGIESLSDVLAALMDQTVGMRTRLAALFAEQDAFSKKNPDYDGTH
ncbi:MAG: hypothetical protein EHM78_01890 [Myxococcaceae bacterium]|nr:MAG: hypothetical protein EHM78_01890 [Myxococcaceae bacterium]